MKNERRVAYRKSVNMIRVENLSSLDPFMVISKTAEIVDVSSSGFLLHVTRNSLVPKQLRSHLNLSTLEGERVMLKISDMQLDIDGVISRTRFIGAGLFEIAIDLSEDAPEYWRECLVDLMPGADEDI